MGKRRLPQHVRHATELFSVNERSDDETKLTGVDANGNQASFDGVIYAVYFRIKRTSFDSPVSRAYFHSVCCAWPTDKIPHIAAC